MAFHKKDDEDERFNPYLNLEKSTVVQEARNVFNKMPLRTRDCAQVLTKLLYLLEQGDVIGTTEATETFFAMTKLFQSKDTSLRRLMYLTIKHMSSMAEDVIIVTSSLTKDMTGTEDRHRAGAIRALCKITDSSMLQGIERYMKQAIVDRHPSVQSAALVSSMHLAAENFDVVKRWVNEVQQALNSRSSMSQFHALGLLYRIKKRDRLAVSKLVASQMRSSLTSSPLACCQLIRYTRKVMEDDPEGYDRSYFEFLETCLRNKSEIVIYEAARAIVNMTNVTAREISPAVSVLQLFLASTKPTFRFAAVRTLNKVAMTHPQALRPCNLDMEGLITDSNRSIATLAITTLLKTGSEFSIDRLMKQISSFMSEISDEFKIVVVESIQSLYVKFPTKHVVLMNFLSNALRDEGGFDYKKAIVDTIVKIVNTIPEARETGLAHLCEFIEDCEFPSLLTSILHTLGIEGPKSPSPGKYIRYIDNRLILENSVVRAAAVSALAKFGTQCPALKQSVKVLLGRCIYDGDDEVRDRATLFLGLLDKDEVAAADLLVNGPTFSPAALERTFMDYISGEVLGAIKMPAAVAPTAIAAEEAVAATTSGSKKEAKTTKMDEYAAKLRDIPEFSAFGPLLKSSAAEELTEAELEYVVKCIKHVFSDRIVFEFLCTNTVNDQKLEDITIQLEGGEQEEEEYETITVACPSLEFEITASTYVAMKIDPATPAQSFTATMKFIVKDCDPESGEADEEGYPDTYNLEDVDLQLSDFMQAVDKPNFAAAWQTLEEANEMEDVFALTSIPSIEEATQKIISILGMHPCEKSHRVVPDKASHSLYLAGKYVDGAEVLASAKLIYDEEVTLQLTVRSPDEELCQRVIDAVG